VRRWMPSLFVSIVVTLICAAQANASVAHTVQPGETLWSIAAANNFTTRSLAAANGLPENAQVVVGTTINIPSEEEAAAALGATSVPATGAGSVDAGAPPAAGGYLVQPGDTLSAIASRSGVGLEQLAWMNGINPAGVLLVGTPLKLPTASPLAAEAPAPAPAPEAVPESAPYPSAGHVTAPEIGQIAASHGVSASLATAIAWQESGFNNAAVSSANARGVMQLLPGTWSWVQQNLAGGQLDSSSPASNVQAGVMYLDQLVADAQGDEALAAAFYYQGEASVRKIGLLPETERYVANVSALRGRFGTP
jgi:LysM repeat protein